MKAPQPVRCDELHYPTGGPFARYAIREMTDERILELLGPRAQLTWLHRRRIECEALRRGLPAQEAP